MFTDLSPLKKNPEFRKLFIGQTISLLGSMISLIAIPYQIYEITKSSLLVGLVSTVELVPLLVTGLYGGILADAIDRRKLLIFAEIGLLICSLFFILNCLLGQSLTAIFVIAALSSALVGIHRPSMDALIPQIIQQTEMTSVLSLDSLRYAIASTAGPAIGGLLIAQIGIISTYAIDALTFLISIFVLYRMKSILIPEALEKPSWSSFKEGFCFVIKTPVILGSYLVDIIAMIFAMPIVLYPQLADELGQKNKIGILYAAIPIGSALVAIFSKPLDKVNKQGAGVILSAVAWGCFMIMMAMSKNILVIGFALVLAGVADGVSGIFRRTIWNEVIPTNMLGRVSGLGMISYMLGPLLGNVRAGAMASMTNTYASILSGGILCALACLSCIWLFPDFWSYERRKSE